MSDHEHEHDDTYGTTQTAALPDRGVVGGVVPAGGKNYAIGLIWETADDTAKMGPVAVEAAKAHKADLVILRKGGFQYGVGLIGTGHRSGMASAAALLTDAYDGSFIGAFEVPGGYYVVGSRDGKVLSITDRIIVDRQEAINTFTDLYYQIDDWTESISPKDWDIETKSHDRIDDALTGLKPTSKLKPISSKVAVIKLAGVLTVLALMGGGYLYYQDIKEQSALEEEAAQRLQSADAQAKDAAARRAALSTIPELPHIGKPSGIAVLAACTDAIITANLAVPGWKPMSAACDGRVVAFTFQRDGGTLNWIGPALNRPGFKPSVSLNNSGSALVSWQIPAQAPFYTKDSLTGTVSADRRYLTSQFEEIYHQIEMADADGEPFEIAGARGQKQKVVYYRTLAISFRTRHDPKEFAKILAPIPALVTKTVRLDLGTWTWTIEGISYEKVQLADTATPPGRQAAAPAR